MTGGDETARRGGSRFPRAVSPVALIGFTDSPVPGSVRVNHTLNLNDESGGAVPGATITLTGPALEIPRWSP